MTKIFRGLAAFLMATLTFSASALTVSMTQQAGDGWKQFSQDLVDDKLMVQGADRFQTLGISNAMYNMLTDAQKATVTRMQFHQLVLLENNLNAETLLADFPRIARSLKVPDIQVPVAKANLPATTSAPAAAAATTPPATTETKPIITIENVEAKLKDLAAKVDLSQAETLRRIAKLQDELKQAATVDELKKVAARITPEVRTMYEKLDERLKIVETDVGVLQGEVATLKSAAGNSETGLKAFEGTVARLGAQQQKNTAAVAILQSKQTSVDTLWNWVYGIAAMVVLLTVGVISALWRRPEGDAKAAAPAATARTQLRAVNDPDGPTYMPPSFGQPAKAFP